MGDDMRYAEAVEVIKTAILRSQYRASSAANAESLNLYYAVGGYLSACVQARGWGQGALKEISGRLRHELPGLRGFSERNLYKMKAFFEAWSPMLDASGIFAVATAKLGGIELLQSQLQNQAAFPAEEFLSIGFTHHCLILASAKDYDERLYYVLLCAREHLSVELLKRAVKNDDFHRRGGMPNNFLATMSDSQRALRAVLTFKDEYLLDFINVEELGVRDEEDIDERVVEQGIVKNVKDFMMEFGRGFSFIANSYHLDAFGDDQFVDLLFFNRILNCLVAVELKRGKFKPAYLGQLSAYLALLDEFDRQPHENPAIGIVLCKDMNKAFVSLVIQSYNSPMGVATYSFEDDVPDDLRSALPNIDDLRALLEGDVSEEEEP